MISDVSTEWPDPEPLTALVDGQPYPTDALPPLLRDAIEEAQAFVQSPAALVACSALSALSLAAQGLANVRRDHQLVGPVSLYLLAVAESGERKTTCDRIFGAALRGWERDRAAACAPGVAAHEAALASAEAKRAGLLEAIKRKRRDMQETTEEDAALEELAIHAPVPVAVPRLLYADATPEALSHALATGWPSAAVLSAEAGAVFGAHGMGYETILRNLALLNVFWDGGEIAVDRRSKSSFQLRDRRLTFGVMVQPEAWRGFMARAGALPRGTGFIARFLIAWPASTQGQRLYRPAPAEMPAVERFNRRIRELLDMPLTTDANGGLVPTVLDLSPSAHAAWVQAHDTIERELGRRWQLRTRSGMWRPRRQRTSRGWPPCCICWSTARRAPSAGHASNARRSSSCGTCRKPIACWATWTLRPRYRPRSASMPGCAAKPSAPATAGYRPRGCTDTVRAACATTRT